MACGSNITYAANCGRNIVKVDAKVCWNRVRARSKETGFNIEMSLDFIYGYHKIRTFDNCVSAEMTSDEKKLLFNEIFQNRCRTK